MSMPTTNTVREWFEAALEQPAAARTAWLAGHCADAGLAARVLAMLRAHEHGNGILDVPAAHRIGDLEDGADPPAEGLIGTRIGGFRLVRLLGQGGMATVFLGEREDGDFRQRVAVKLLRRGLYSDLEQRLFRRERQALASLSHPHIAHLIDGGITDAGIPYLVMEYIDGQPVTRHAVAEQLDLRARLHLFVAICRAVEAAHRNLIVHRDIKPSNILVDAEGRPKLLDFGIAKLLDEDETATRSGLVPLTPGYAAPEQFAGGAITTATDVYALGVLLHELLLGERPRADPGMQRASARVSELTTDLWQLPGSRATLRSALRGDLDNVLLTAMAAEPARRYASAGALADDIERHLDARPVMAHPPSHWYRAKKFVQRHRGGVLVTVALVLGVVASLGIAVWQAQVAQAQAQRAERVRDFLLEVFDAASSRLPREVRPTPDVLARAAAKRVDADGSLDAATRADFLGALGAISHTSSDYAQALDYAERALAALDGAGDTGSRRRLDLEIARADALHGLGRDDDAERLLAGRLDAIRASADATAVNGLAAAAAVRLSLGRLDHALALAREAGALADRVYGRDHAQALGAGLLPGDMLAGAGRHAQAVGELESALARWRASTATPDRAYVDSLQNLASSKYFLGDYEACERLLHEALQRARDIHEPPHEQIADALQNLGVLASSRGRFDEAEAPLGEAAAMYEALFGPDHPQVAGAHAALGVLAIDRARYADAVEAFTRVTAICTRAKLDADPVCPRNWQNLSHAYLKLGRLDEAEAANARGLEMRRTLYGERHPQTANALSGRATILLARGDAAAALASLDEALAIVSANAQDESLDAAIMRASRARALRDLDRGDEALAALDRAEAIFARLSPDDGARRLALLALRAETLDRLRRGDEARASARAALALAAHRDTLEAARWERLQALAR